MRALKQVVAAHERELRTHRLFHMLEATTATEPLVNMAKALGWWPLVFQDVLRLSVDRVRGSRYERFAEYRQYEDSDHERWFLHDLRAFAIERPHFDEIFAREFQPLRDVCYALAGEIYRTQSSAEAIALLLALEPTGRAFFEGVSSAVDRLCPDLPLRYFARSHLSAQDDYDLFTETTEAELNRIVLSGVERVRCEELVVRVYRTFEDFFSYLADCVGENLRTATDVRALQVSPHNLRPLRELEGR